MYINDGVSISKASDGTFLISCRVKKKSKKEGKGNGKDMPIAYDSDESKTLTAATIDEALEKVREMLPTLENGCMPEEAFNKAFEEATE